MATKLQIWKQALVHLEKATISTLTDDVEAVNVFTNAWAGAVEEAFNSGDWNFAKASVALSANDALTPALGWSYAFSYPATWLRTVAINDRADFSTRFYDYADEGGQLSANTATLYLRYISTTNMADANISTWPTMFWRYVALLLAYDTCGKLTSGDTLEEKIRRRLEIARNKAKSVDARNENNKVLGAGSWIASRYGTGTGRGRMGGALVGGEITFSEGDV